MQPRKFSHHSDGTYKLLDDLVNIPVDSGCFSVNFTETVLVIVCVAGPRVAVRKGSTTVSRRGFFGRICQSPSPGVRSISSVIS
ncbi:hypothetical protein MASR2M17_19660 [Aminivibrio sp.]